jgi:hypothetical protein
MMSVKFHGEVIREVITLWEIAAKLGVLVKTASNMDPVLL